MNREEIIKESLEVENNLKNLDFLLQNNLIVMDHEIRERYIARRVSCFEKWIELRNILLCGNIRN